MSAQRAIVPRLGYRMDSDHGAPLVVGRSGPPPLIAIIYSPGVFLWFLLSQTPKSMFRCTVYA